MSYERRFWLSSSLAQEGGGYLQKHLGGEAHEAEAAVDGQIRGTDLLPIPVPVHLEQNLQILKNFEYMAGSIYKASGFSSAGAHMFCRGIRCMPTATHMQPGWDAWANTALPR